ncbi:MAG TPA: hypothetical protein VFB50_22830, partial [Chloroflexota bacterium]|nr:hypothetical protein [Chloroflexota bacterium]
RRIRRQTITARLEAGRYLVLLPEQQYAKPTMLRPVVETIQPAVRELLEYVRERDRARDQELSEARAERDHLMGELLMAQAAVAPQRRWSPFEWLRQLWAAQNLSEAVVVVPELHTTGPDFLLAVSAASGLILETGQRLCDALEYTREALRGKPAWLTFRPGEDMDLTEGETVRRARRLRYRQVDLLESDLWLRAANGQPVWFHQRVSWLSGLGVYIMRGEVLEGAPA